MTKLATYVKQPAEVKDYDIDYGPWLTPVEDTLDTIEVSIICLTDPSDTELVCQPFPPMTATVCKLWISGGTDGANYKVTVRATTVGTAVGSRVDESELIFKIKDY
jgi:hypothetical protein